MQQIILINGGDAFDTYEEYLANLRACVVDYERLRPKQSWKQWLAMQLSHDDVLLPSFPNPSNAQYDEWKVMFEKILPFLSAGCIFVGHSLGGSFLLKYCSENTLPFTPKKIIFVAAPYGDVSSGEIGSFRVTPNPKLVNAADEIHFLHSRDDTLVSFDDFLKFKKQFPKAHFHEFHDRGHFLDTEFPEMIHIIKN